jgi:hypothetical protein
MIVQLSIPFLNLMFSYKETCHLGPSSWSVEQLSMKLIAPNSARPPHINYIVDTKLLINLPRFDKTSI